MKKGEIMLYKCKNNYYPIKIVNNNNKTLLYAKQIDTKILSPTRRELIKAGKDEENFCIFCICIYFFTPFLLILQTFLR